MMVERKWCFRGEDTLDKMPLAPLPSMPNLIWQVLYSRGIRTVEKIEDWISPKLLSMTSPLALDGMKESTERLVHAFLKKEKICIYADFDLDGSSGLTLLKTALEVLGFRNLVYIQPRRLKEGYGFHKDLVQEVLKKGVQLIVTVDVGISDFEAVEEARQSGIDVIITDHHLPKDRLPKAYSIVNPNKGSCSSKLEHLCGAGVAFYLILALRVEMKRRGLLKEDFDPKDLLDCFVIGTLADMVPLKNENRVLIKHGLMVLKNTKRPGLQELLKQLDLWEKDLTSQQVSLRFAPKINALSRMEEDLLPVDLFLVEDRDRAKQFVQKVLVAHQKRLVFQKEAEEEAFQALNEDSMDYKSEATRRRFILVCSRNFHKGVLGLIATRLSQEYFCPAFVGFIDEEKDCILGSARGYSLSQGHELYSNEKKGFNPKDRGEGEKESSYRSDNLLYALEHSSSFLTKFGGHAMAAGFQLEFKNLKAFEESLSGYYNQGSPPPIPKVFYDGWGRLSEVNHHLMNWLDRLDPFGKAFEIPVFLIQDVELLSIRSLRGGHLKFLFKEKNSYYQMEGLWFSPSRAVYSSFLDSKYFKDSSYSYYLGDHRKTNLDENQLGFKSKEWKNREPEDEGFDILVEPQWNDFRGNKKIQLLIRDLKPVHWKAL